MFKGNDFGIPPDETPDVPLRRPKTKPKAPTEDDFEVIDLAEEESETETIRPTTNESSDEEVDLEGEPPDPDGTDPSRPLWPFLNKIDKWCKRYPSLRERVADSLTRLFQEDKNTVKVYSRPTSVQVGQLDQAVQTDIIKIIGPDPGPNDKGTQTEWQEMEAPKPTYLEASTQVESVEPRVEAATSASAKQPIYGNKGAIPKDRRRRESYPTSEPSGQNGNRDRSRSGEHFPRATSAETPEDTGPGGPEYAEPASPALVTVTKRQLPEGAHCYKSARQFSRRDGDQPQLVERRIHYYQVDGEGDNPPIRRVIRGRPRCYLCLARGHTFMNCPVAAASR
ncbi:uncharacterized protein [Prorops nasuta]|uniref:uncharacterized protein n=1 Tax=Prorops nasuta TaxID=863751 RepID=UPI0034CF716B